MKITQQMYWMRKTVPTSRFDQWISMKHQELWPSVLEKLLQLLPPGCLLSVHRIQEKEWFLPQRAPLFVLFLCFLCYSLFVPEKLAKKPRPESTNCSTSNIKIDCFLQVPHVRQCLDCNSKRRLNISKGPNEDAKKDFAKQEEKSKPKPPWRRD